MNRSGLLKSLLLLLTMIIMPTLVSGGGNPSLNGGDILGSWEILKAVTPKQQILPLEGQVYQIRFMADGRIHMKFENNVINGKYETEGANLRLPQPLMMTMAAWQPDSPAPRFLTLMENATNYFFKDELLYVDTLADGGTLQLRKVAE